MAQTGIIDSAFSSGIISNNAHNTVNDLPSTTTNLLESDSGRFEEFMQAVEEQHLENSSNNSKNSKSQKNKSNNQRHQNHQNNKNKSPAHSQVFDQQMEEQLLNIKNIHSNTDIQKLFGPDINQANMGDDLRDSLIMKMVPIMKLDSSINFDSNSYEYEYGQEEMSDVEAAAFRAKLINSINLNHMGSFSELTSQRGDESTNSRSDEDLDMHFARFSKDLADYDVEHSVLDELRV